MACKKKLYTLNPKTPPQTVLTQRTKLKQRTVPSDPKSLEREVRQLLADKVSGTLVGIWLLIPEHLRLGTWDLLCSWSAGAPEAVEPRLGLQLVHEAALCTCNLREGRTLSQKGFELANGLPFVAADQPIHDLLDAHTVAQAQALQVALGKLRRASGHFAGKVLVIDPHRMLSYSKRQMSRIKPSREAKPTKMSQTFFLLDADTQQPICMTVGSAARRATVAGPELLALARQILPLDPQAPPLVLADEEHYSAEYFDPVVHAGFDLLVPMTSTRYQQARWRALPQDQFTRHWAGYAILKQPYVFSRDELPGFEYIQRSAERPEDYEFKGYFSNADRPEVPTLTAEFPKRWHVEEFFKFNQDLGWRRAGTLNLNIRYGHMTMALLAQTVIHQFRQRIGQPFQNWDATHLATNLLAGLDGDIRVCDDTVVVTYYNAPNVDLLRAHYENLPAKLQADRIDPHIPWLYNFKLDFRFK
jgi:hypothetical protein